MKRDRPRDYMLPTNRVASPNVVTVLPQRT
ncbi:MAG: hypothetical protein QOH11_2611, partial [Solirubrobacteraceae bacterium]|nr:hypothetical protein [Solirubrobacteraceae bacterium]